MKFGGATIVIIDRAQVGDPDDDGNYDFEDVEYEAKWCRHRPMSFQETVDANLDVATEWWRSTIPIHMYSADVKAAIQAIKPDAIVTIDGDTYQVNAGDKTHPGWNGSPFKTTIISKKQTG